MSARDSANVKIGQTWGTAQRDGAVSSSLTFTLTAAAKAEVSGSVPVTAGGTWGGLAGPDPILGTINYATNQVNARWDFTYPGVGTADFKGNVGHALYEWRMADTRIHHVDTAAASQARY